MVGNYLTSDDTMRLYDQSSHLALILEEIEYIRQ